MHHDKIQAKGYKHICDQCECDAGGAQCKPRLHNYLEIAEGIDRLYYCYTPSCLLAHGQMCSYYRENYIKPRLKDDV